MVIHHFYVITSETKRSVVIRQAMKTIPFLEDCHIIPFHFMIRSDVDDWDDNKLTTSPFYL